MKTIQINPADNVAVAIEALKKGETVEVNGQRITLTNDVPAGHKILLTDLKEGENVIKYGYPIGHLKEDHRQGDTICHDHIKTNLSGLLDYEYKPVGKFVTSSEGSPPHTWGIPTYRPCPHVPSGLTPTYVGNTLGDPIHLLHDEAHPHIRGEYSFSLCPRSL